MHLHFIITSILSCFTQTTPFADVFYGLAYGRGVFVGVSSSGTTRVMTAFDGNFEVTSLAVDQQQNNVVLGGWQTAPLTFAPRDWSSSPSAFVLEFTWSLQYLWAGQMNGTSWHVGTDSVGSVWVVGEYTGNLTLPAFLPNAGRMNVFLAKYSTAGNFLSASGVSGTDDQTAAALTIDSTGSVMVAGAFLSPSLDVYTPGGTTIATTITRGGAESAYFVKFDNAGVVVSTSQLRPTENPWIILTTPVDNSFASVAFGNGIFAAVVW